jgi:hypothetical protein
MITSRKLVRRVTQGGVQYWTLGPIMPRIASYFLKCVVYLYDSEEAALRGERYGGSGFIVGVQSKTKEEYTHLYVVTNEHVVRKGCRWIRTLIHSDAKPDIIESKTEQWEESKTDDVVVYSFGAFGRDVPYSFVPINFILTETLSSELSVGPGDDTFMVGRLTRHDGGKERNTPSVRFGNISMMPDVPIEHDGRSQYSFIVETRSLPGYSGSPVFVTIPKLTEWPEPKKFSQSSWTNLHQKLVIEGPVKILLGVDCGHLPVEREIVLIDEHGKETKHKTKVNTGMAIVIPGWKILELVNLPTFQSERTGIDRQLGGVGPDVTEPD